MHVVNLAIGYTLGIKDNTKTTTTMVDGKKTKEKVIVTPGGRFDH